MLLSTRFSVSAKSTVATAFTAKSALRCGVQIVALATGIGYENLVHTAMWCQQWLASCSGSKGRIYFGV
jgi:hypothetical protein